MKRKNRMLRVLATVRWKRILRRRGTWGTYPRNVSRQEKHVYIRQKKFANFFELNLIRL